MAFGESSPSVSKKRGLGCPGCGCGLLLLIILLLLAAFGYSSYHTAIKETNATPAVIPHTDNGPEAYSTAQHKIATFGQDIQHSQPATLRLNSDEINTFIARDPSAASVRGHLFVTMQGDEATLRSSVALGAIENVVLADRYADVNVTISLAFDPQTQSITVNAHNISVKGQTEPSSIEPIINQAINTVIAQKIQANPSARDFLSHAKKITIENGELVIETK